MAEMQVDGLEELMLSLEAAANIPADVQDAMLNAQADVVVSAQKAKGRAYGVEDTGLLMSSITKGKPKQSKEGRLIYVYPRGTRTRGANGRLVRNGEIAFVNEYGTRSQRARPFIRDANESSAEATTEAAASVYDSFLRSKNL